MKSKEMLTINVNLDWRILVILGVIGAVLALSYSVAGAQGGEPPRTNEVQVEPTAELPETAPLTVPDSPEAQSDDVAYTVNGEWVPRDTVGVAPPASVGANDISAQALGGRLFYLTEANYATNQAKTACAGGYHMASLWEILDVSNLTYDYDHPAAYVKADSGQGPPSYWYGWVRTGYDSSGSATTGTGNCNNWSSTSSSISGVSVRLSSAWETVPGDIFSWDATSFTCNYTGPVWCVED